MQYAVGEGHCTFLCSYDTIDSWDVENTWLISLIRISGQRQMKGIQISNTRTHGKHFGLRMGTRYSEIQRICMQSESYKACEGWATGEGDADF
jgi:hypothetical protein